MRLIGYSLCECGAVTVFSDRNQENYSCRQENFSRFFPDIKLEDLKQVSTSHICNHCVNHYGLDLCGCGSGAFFGECNENLDECRKPMQAIDLYVRATSKDTDSGNISNSIHDLKDILIMENETAEKIQRIKNTILKEIKDISLPGVQKISENTMSVNFSQLCGGILSPEYYHQETQAQYVEYALKNVSTAHGFMDAVQKMICEKSVKMGCNTYPLNERTLEVLHRYQ